MNRMIAMILSVLLCLSLAACSETHSSQTQDSASSGQESITSGQEAGSASDAAEPGGDDGMAEGEGQMMTVETQYGALSYPAKWEDVLVTSESVENEIDSVVFSVIVQEQKYDLFKVMICDAEGDSVGTLTDHTGQVRNVFVDIPEFSDLTALSEEEQNQLYAMQEAVNVLIEYLE